MLVKMNPKTKEVVIDSIMMLCLFYIIAHPKTYAAVADVLPKSLMKDPVLVHAVVFSVVYLSIQKFHNKF